MTLSATRPALAALFLLLLCLNGCAPKPTLVGKWQGTTTGPQGMTVAGTYDFTQDGKETVSFATSGGPISITMGGTGTYTVSGNSLTQNITTMTMGTMTVPLPPDKAKPQTGTFTLDGDHLTLTSPTSQKTMTLTRVKQ